MVVSVMLSDDGKTFSAKANAAITAGDIVRNVSSDDEILAMNKSSYALDDICVQQSGSNYENIVCGVALEDAASGDTLAIQTRGVFLFEGDNVTAGAKVSARGLQVEELTAGSEGFYNIGRALTGTSNADAKYLVVLCDFA